MKPILETRLVFSKTNSLTAIQELDGVLRKIDDYIQNDIEVPFEKLGQLQQRACHLSNLLSQHVLLFNLVNEI